MKREKNLETILVISTGLIVIYSFTHIKSLLIIALLLNIIGLCSNFLAGKINWLWFKIAELLGFITSKVLLSIVFFVFLLPISLLYRLFNRNSTMQLKKTRKTYYFTRNHKYTPKDLENVW
ncbi:MAG: hypothetical protein PHX21_02765 [bacterium]|nr:hypothetical protein [bacterium]